MQKVGIQLLQKLIDRHLPGDVTRGRGRKDYRVSVGIEIHPCFRKAERRLCPVRSKAISRCNT